MGGALALALYRTGFRLDTLVYRCAKPGTCLLNKLGADPKTIPFEEVADLESDVVILTTQDTELKPTTDQLASKIGRRSVLLHTSGSLSSDDVLGAAADRGIPTGSMHPLVSVSDPELGAERFTGAYFCIEGTPAAHDAATEIVAALQGHPFFIESRFKPLYHASAVLASGHFVALFSAAVRSLSRCGIDDDEAKDALLPLVHSSLENLRTQAIPASLTGPFARADVAAIERHLSAFDASSLADEKDVYLALGLEALRLAEQCGVGYDRIGEIRRLIMFARATSK